jgi:ankyrin repeat protein
MVDDVQAVHDAASTGDIDKLWDLIEHDMGLLEATHDSDSPLSRAAEHGQVEVARFLLDQGVDVNRRLFQGWTALCAACYAGHLRVAELLLKRGADATQTTSSGSGPLILASEEGHADVVALLIARGCADIDATDAVYRHTALWLASCNGHAGAARGLLDAGADFLRADGRGRSPLLIASRQRHAACVAPLEVRALGGRGWGAAAAAGT